jgi:predicted enzyme related to lactoylglutathione lyase
MALKPNSVNWFEIPAKDLSRATRFYESTFDIELTLKEMGPSLMGAPLKMAFFPGEKDAPGASGSLVKSEGYTPSHQGPLIYFSVDNIENVLKKIERNNGKTLAPKSSIGEYGFIALFEDTEGNRIGLHSVK